MLDVISGGRLNLGAARGGTAQEMALCGVDPEETVAQVKEALTFIGHCWREDTIEWESELLSIHPPPIARRTPSSAARAAAPPAAVPGVHQPGDGAAGRASTASARWCSASAVPR